jgi:hypothetical protein
LSNKYFTEEVKAKALQFPQEDQQRLLDALMVGLCNGEASVGAVATSPEDYDKFGFFFEPLIR